ncbi:MAG TPA: DUF4199 domain-containing protein [Mucilaginibacter sp.]|jgi:hypothetical protein|nr:DUF4199 domain-containing protein [Mucilaginibacter sp.]
MEKIATQNATKVATKWAVIYVITSIVITYLFQLLNIDQSSGVKYLGYIPFIAFLLLAQKEYRDQLGGFMSFGDGFSAGFRYAVFAGVMLAVFIFIYLTFLSPQILEQSIASQQGKFKEQGLSSEQIERANDIGRKYGAVIGAFGAAIGSAILGAILALIGAAIFKKERTLADIERDSASYTDPAV